MGRVKTHPIRGDEEIVKLLEMGFKSDYRCRNRKAVVYEALSTTCTVWNTTATSSPTCG